MVDLTDIEIGTIDSFQGREKDIIIFSITATEDLKFVAHPNRLNVAFTRARRKLIVVGNLNSVNKVKNIKRLHKLCSREERNIWLEKTDVIIEKMKNIYIPSRENHHL